MNSVVSIITTAGDEDGEVGDITGGEDGDITGGDITGGDVPLIGIVSH